MIMFKGLTPRVCVVVMSPADGALSWNGLLSTSNIVDVSIHIAHKDRAVHTSAGHSETEMIDTANP